MMKSNGILLRLVVTVIVTAMSVPASAQGDANAPAVQAFPPIRQMTWSFTNGPEFPGAKGTYDFVREVKGAPEALMITYDFSEGGAYVGVTGDVRVSGRMRALVFDVNAVSPCQLLVRFFDRTGQCFQKVVSLAEAGVQTVRVEVGSPWVAVFGGANDGGIHWPIGRMLLGVGTVDPPKGKITFGNLRGEFLPASAQELRVEEEQRAFEATLKGWRGRWNDLLRTAADLDEIHDRNVRLESYGHAVDAGAREALSKRAKKVWEAIDGIGLAWDEATKGYARAQTDDDLSAAANKTAAFEAAFETAEADAKKTREEALAALGAQWLDARAAQAPDWVPGRDRKETFGDRWHMVLSHTRPEDVEAGIIRSQDFAAVALENLYPRLEPDGELDADHISRVESQIRKCADSGVRAVPNFFNTALDGQWGPELPEWFIEKHGRENVGLRYGAGPRITPNYWYPPVVSFLADYVGRIAAHFKGDPRVLAFEFWNEPAMYQVHEVYTDKWVRKAYVRWLEKRYRTVDALNRRWGATYVSFADVAPPKGFTVLDYDAPRAEFARTFDFRLFLRESFADFFRTCVEAFHAGNDTHPIMPQFCSYFNFHQDNMMDTWLDESVGWDVAAYHEGGGTMEYYVGGWGFGELNYTASHAAILGKPSFADEYIWVFAESDPRFQKSLYGRELGPDVIRRGGRRNLWEQLAWGKCGVVAFSLRFSSPWGNDLLVNEQRLHPKAGALLRMRGTAERVREITRDTEIAFAPVAILETVDATYLSRPSEIPLSDARALNHFCVQRHMPTFYLPERAVLAGEASLDDFRVILAPWCYILSRDMSDMLAAWVQAGGYLIASGPIGLMDGYRREGTALSKLLPESAGLAYPDATVDAAALSLPDGDRIEMNPWRHVLWRRSERTLPAGVKALLSLADGLALVTETRAGKGWIVQSLVPLGMLSTSLGGANIHFLQGYAQARIPLGTPEKALEEELWKIIARHGDMRPVRSETADVRIVRHRGPDGKDYVFAINLNPLAPANVAMDVPGRSAACRDIMLNGCPVPTAVSGNATHIALTLAPGDGTVLELKGSSPPAVSDPGAGSTGAQAARPAESKEKAMITITKGPWLQWVTREAVTVMWETPEESSSSVTFYETENVHSDSDGRAKTLEGTARTVDDETSTLIHAVTVSSLETDTTYHYKVVSSTEGGDTVSSELYPMKTAVARETPFSFVVTSETGGFGDEAINRRVFDQLQRYRGEFLLMVGDSVARGSVYEDWEKYFFGPGKELFAHTPFYLCPGNHEENADWFYKFVAYPEPKNYYAFDYGNARFVALDSTRMIANNELGQGSAQHEFLADALRSSDATWKIVFFHYPPYVSGDFEVAALRALCPVMEEHGVDLVFNSHTIVYERSHPIRSDKLDLKNGITYVVAGGAGAVPQWFHPKRAWHTAQAVAVPHFVQVIIADTTLRLNAIDENGYLFDTLTLRK